MVDGNLAMNSFFENMSEEDTHAAIDKYIHSETWKDIEGYEGLYQVSKSGKVRCIKDGQDKLMGFSISCRGYVRVRLVKDKAKNKRVHRLVAHAFIPNPENKEEVNHKDGDKLNNNDWNLEWNTHTENQHHARSTGLFINKLGPKMTKRKVINIRNSPLPQNTLAKKYGVSTITIGHIITKKTWKNI